MAVWRDYGKAYLSACTGTVYTIDAKDARNFFSSDEMGLRGGSRMSLYFGE
jgi:hypothetical protein